MNYVICTTGRARSSVLMVYLKQLGAGHADEWTNCWFDKERDYNDLDSLCGFIRNKNIDGHSGLRLTWNDLMAVCETHQVQARTFFDKCLPDAKYIYFTRDNLLQVAETLYYERLQLFDDAVSDDVIPVKDIYDRLVYYAIGETAWENFFAEYNIIPLRITCEELEHAEFACRRVLDFLGIEYPKNVVLKERIRDTLVKNDNVQKWYNEILKNYQNVIGD